MKKTIPGPANSTHDADWLRDLFIHSAVFGDIAAEVFQTLYIKVYLGTNTLGFCLFVYCKRMVAVGVL